MVIHKIRDLVFDHEYYPRQQIDWDHVQRLVDALEVGAKLPPIIICKDTKRIVDGCHRAKAVQRLKGDRAEIQCIEKIYANQQAYFLDCVQYNSEHGLALTARDRFKILELGEELKIDPAITAAVMKMSTVAVGKLSVAPACGPVGSGESTIRVSPRFGAPRIRNREAIHHAPPPREPFYRPDHRPAPAPVPRAEHPVRCEADLDMVKRLIHRLEEDKINFDDPEMTDQLVRLTELLVALELQA